MSTKKPFDEAFGMVETEATQNFRHVHPRKHLFCRIRDSFFLTSGAYGRGSRADFFVAISLNEDILLGEILFFYEDETKKCVLRKKHIISKIKLVRGAFSESAIFGFFVSDSQATVKVPVAMIAYKLFHFVFKEKNYLVKIMRHFEHNWLHHVPRSLIFDYLPCASFKLLRIFLTHLLIHTKLLDNYFSGKISYWLNFSNLIFLCKCIEELIQINWDST